MKNGDNSFCKSCDKTVGTIVLRPTGQVWAFGIIALLSFAGLIFASILAEPSFAQSYAQQKWGAAHGETGLSDWWLLLPSGLLLLTVQRFTAVTRVCPICNCKL